MTQCPFDESSQQALMHLLTTLIERQDAIANSLSALSTQQATLAQLVQDLGDRLTTIEHYSQESNTQTTQSLDTLTSQLTPLPDSLTTLHAGIKQCVMYSSSLLIELRRFGRKKTPKRSAQSLQTSLETLRQMIHANTQTYLQFMQQLQQPDPILQQALQGLQQQLSEHLAALQITLQTPDLTLQTSLETLTNSLEILQQQLEQQMRSIASLTQSIEQWQNNFPDRSNP